MARTSLREYQESLAARLRTAEAADASRSRLGMEAGGARWLLDLTDVAEVVPVPEILPVPLTRPWFAGIVNIRGTLFSIVDFPAFIGAAPVTLNEHARLLLVGDKHRINSGLLFDRVVGLRQAQSFQPIEADVADPPPWIEGYCRDKDDRRWQLLAMGALLQDPGFLQIEL